MGAPRSRVAPLPTLLRAILWIDGGGGIAVGCAMAALHGTLLELFGVPRPVLLFVTAANLAYGCFGLFVAGRTPRPLALVVTLARANLAWGAVCATLFVRYAGEARPLGLAHLVLEGTWVTGLGLLEWRNRAALSAEPRRG